MRCLHRREKGLSNAAQFVAKLATSQTHARSCTSAVLPLSERVPPSPSSWSVQVRKLAVILPSSFLCNMEDALLNRLLARTMEYSHACSCKDASCQNKSCRIMKTANIHFQSQLCGDKCKICKNVRSLKILSERLRSIKTQRGTSNAAALCNTDEHATWVEQAQ